MPARSTPAGPCSVTTTWACTSSSPPSSSWASSCPWPCTGGSAATPATTAPPSSAPAGPPPLTSHPHNRLPDPAAPLRRCAGGEPAGDAEAGHQGGDVPADSGGAQPGAAGDRVVVQPFGHQCQDRLLSWRRPVRRRYG